MPRIPTDEWIKNKLDTLKKMVDIVRKENPELYSIEPDYGFWSLKKEVALMYWLYPFQQIANKYFDAYYYLDLFAGSGLMKAEDDFFVGSPVVAVCSTQKANKFKKYICLEANEERAKTLAKRMDAVCKYFNTCTAEVHQADCNEKLESVLKELPSTERLCYLAFIDPQGIDLKWETFKRLLKLETCDIILNFPTYGIHRNLTNPESEKCISDFIGNNSWKGKDIEQVLDSYKQQTLCYRDWVGSIEVKNMNGRRLYDLVFATNSKGLTNAFDDLRKRLDEMKTKNIGSFYSIVAKGQQQLPF